MSVFLFLVQYKNVINFSKRRQQFNIVQNMRRFRNEVHNFPRHDRIIEFFSNFDDFLSEEAMWQMSETIKPRGKPKHWPGVLVCCESRDKWPLWNAGPIQSNRSLFCDSKSEKYSSNKDRSHYCVFILLVIEQGFIWPESAPFNTHGSEMDPFGGSRVQTNSLDGWLVVL